MQITIWSSHDWSDHLMRMEWKFCLCARKTTVSALRSSERDWLNVISLNVVRIQPKRAQRRKGEAKEKRKSHWIMSPLQIVVNFYRWLPRSKKGNCYYYIGWARKWRPRRWEAKSINEEDFVLPSKHEKSAVPNRERTEYIEEFRHQPNASFI